MRSRLEDILQCIHEDQSTEVRSVVYKVVEQILFGSLSKELAWEALIGHVSTIFSICNAAIKVCKSNFPSSASLRWS